MRQKIKRNTQKALCLFKERDRKKNTKTLKPLALKLLRAHTHTALYLWLFGIKLVSLLLLHVQAFIGAAVHLRDGRRGGGTDIAVVPAPVAAAAAVGELAAATLHVGWRR